MKFKVFVDQMKKNVAPLALALTLSFSSPSCVFESEKGRNIITKNHVVQIEDIQEDESQFKDYSSEIEREKPPLGEKIGNGKRFLTDLDIENLIGLWKNNITLSSELPEEVKTFLNASFYGAYNFDIPDNLSLSLLSEYEFSYYFGENVLGGFVSTYWTIYGRETTFAEPLLTILTHEMGHVVDTLDQKPANEFHSWFSQKYILIKMEGMLPSIGLSPFELWVGENYGIQGPKIITNQIDHTLYPFLSVYGADLMHYVWETERAIQNGEELDKNTIADHMGWILLAKSGSFEKARDVLRNASLESLKKITMEKRDDSEFYLMMEDCSYILYQELLSSKYGKSKNHFALFNETPIKISTLKLLRAIWSLRNRYEYLGYSDTPNICENFQVKNESEILGCYGPFSE